MSAIDSIKNTLSRYLDCPSRQVVIGYSGGVDSHLLLYLVHQLRQQFSQHRYLAVHINHGLSPNALQWQEHCQEVCESMQIDFAAIEVTLDMSSGLGLEATAREARYSALNSVTEHNGMILLGQHIDDQLETFLLQLKRGAGPRGLSAMAESMVKVNKINTLRPLLSVSRQEIEHLATAAKLAWINDESNQDIRFDRNFLRHQVVPVLQQRWPTIAQSVHRSASLCAEQQLLLDEVAAGYLAKLTAQDNSIDIDALLTYSIQWQRQIVRYWLSQQRIPMPSEAVLNQLSLLLNTKQDGSPVVQFSGFQFRRFKNALFCIANYVIPDPHSIYRVHNGVAELPGEMGSVQVSMPGNEEDHYFQVVPFSTRFKPQSEQVTKSLKQWFKVWQYPVWKREQAMMLFNQQRPLGVLIDGQFIVSDDAPESLQEQVKCTAKINTP
ncbi:tRNA lysidine(34) synthetase TilS [Aliiglaciecola sp.]|nr:tRNA lysidine(34) synthetase TilS [Aliiglaciecola sp.]